MATLCYLAKGVRTGCQRTIVSSLPGDTNIESPTSHAHEYSHCALYRADDEEKQCRLHTELDTECAKESEDLTLAKHAQRNMLYTCISTFTYIYIPQRRRDMAPIGPSQCRTTSTTTYLHMAYHVLLPHLASAFFSSLLCSASTLAALSLTCTRSLAVCFRIALRDFFSNASSPVLSARFSVCHVGYVTMRRRRPQGCEDMVVYNWGA